MPGTSRVTELEDLRRRLAEAEETLDAIRHGEVDALVVHGPRGDQVFSLKGAEQPYRIFLEQMQEGAVNLTLDGTILYCNRRFAEMLRIPLERVIGVPLCQFIDQRQHGEFYELLNNPGGGRIEVLLAIAEEGILPAQLTFSRLDLDEIESVCVVITDLTERNEMRQLGQALDELRATQQQLQHQNEQLILARREAERANEAKDSFLAALSHELRTPLTPVLMAAMVLEEDESLAPEHREDVAMIRRNVELEARLIDDLLDLTRIVRGKIELKRAATDLRALLLSTIDICRDEIELKQLSMVHEGLDEPCIVEADSVRLQQILWNLVRNAVKFTPAGGTVTVRVDKDDAALRINVTDTGIGIEPHALERIFEPFEQGNEQVTRQFGGLGLGLAISRKLAELHGGSITVRSGGSNSGSTFTLTLPVTCRSEGGGQTNADHRPASPQQNLNILLVEDHDDTREGMVRLLGGQHKVEAVATMREALAAAAKQKFDLLISDLGLPDGSGLDLMRQLHRDGTKGICLTGYGTDEDILMSREAGFQEHITKPINPSRLELIINHVTSR